MTSAIITSLLDTDFYKFTMMQCIFHHYPNAQATYRFQCRNQIELQSIKEAVSAQIDNLCTVHFTEDELQYLRSLPFFKTDFINYLSHFKLSRSHVEISEKDFKINIRGPWLETILFEVPLLAIINECYMHTYAHLNSISVGRERLNAKISALQNPDYTDFQFSDFGTRRRFSKNWQVEVLETLAQKCPKQFIGTSNILFSKFLNLNPIGTMAHEYLQAFQVLAPDLKTHQSYALNLWREEYGDLLSIALTDVLGMDAFLADFDATLAQQYRGIRHDSGEPFEWGEKAIRHYQKLGIDPREKVFVFSDRLTFERAFEIYNHFKGRCYPLFGIGTHLMNDLGNTTLDIVIKLFQINYQEVIKTSDSPGKLVADNPESVKKLLSQLSPN